MCAYADKTLISELLIHSWLVFETQIAENLTKMVKEIIQSLKLENDKLKDKIQEILAELPNLRDEVKVKLK